ncbi:hypothetical protein D3272_22350 [Lichenibacterium ramalinae]|uniref:Uncharacterized protein n=2 Tax=Lichenibacterium ramalinae TaxID=2316527 RepID=A0A4V1RI40_9HYPH|nr:hypothetical protein D3272_22350 [Lichenibacterium ramalinae]
MAGQPPAAQDDETMPTHYPAGTRRATIPVPPRARRALLAAAAVLSLSAPVRADDAPPALTGAAAWARLVGNTVSGTTPDGPYDEVFVPDGTLAIVDGDGKAGGTWHWRDPTLCTRVDGEDDEECRTVSVTGTTGAFTDAAGSRYPFEIRQGNAKNL